MFNPIKRVVVVLKAKYDSELRRLRECVGLTRKQMAELVGCSEVAIKRIEYGTLSPSLDLIDRISAKTGCAIQHKNEHWDVLCIDVTNGKDYEKESFSHWQDILAKNVTSSYARTLFGHMLGDLVQVFLYAVKQSKNMEKLYAIFGRALYEVISQSDIGPVFLNRLRQLSKHHNPLAARVWKDHALLPFEGPEKCPIEYREGDIDGTLRELFATLFSASRVKWVIYSTSKRLPENLESAEEFWERQFGKNTSHDR
jgi:transcriptional regulator with XRE-family HTH domain